VKIGYADPPYPGCAHMYKDHADFAGEVDHAELIERLQREYDGWVLHTHEPGLRTVLPLIPEDARVMAWVKPFAAFKRNVSVAYAWEPVIVRPARKPVVRSGLVSRDWVSEPIAMKKGLTGAKPRAVCEWAFHVVGAESSDDLYDLYPGTGAVSEAWRVWRHRMSPETIAVEQGELAFKAALQAAKKQ